MSMARDSNSDCIVMLEKKPVRADPEDWAMRRSMPKPMPHGSKNHPIYRVDYLKYDNCYNTGTSGKIRYFAMSKALN